MDLLSDITMISERHYLIHPLYILITLVLGSITALFVGFSFAYIYTRVQSGARPVDIPGLFYINTLILIGTSYLWTLIKRAYEQDHTSRYKMLLAATLAASVLFLVAQIFAWRQMIQMNVGLTSSTLASYLYVISAVHFIHVIGGIPFLVYFMRDAQRRLVEPASVLLYLSDPDKKRHMRILSIYWHYIDILWIYLIIFFVVNRLI